jgi:hypothetical protein
MGGKFWSWGLANAVRAHLASFLTGLLAVLVICLLGIWFWSWYLANKADVIPLLAPLASFIPGVLTVIVGGTVAFAAVRQAKTATEQSRTAAQQADIARLRHEEQIKTDQERADADRQRLINESFAKAVEQLGSQSPQVRIGGIYTLERLSRESPSDYWPIMETLTGFVRERVPWKEPDTALTQTIPPRYHHVVGPHRSSHRLPTDIAAVLTVIMRRDAENRERERLKKWKLDLSFTDLRGAVLSSAHLENAYLMHTHLEEAYIEKTHLENADLTGAHLRQANLFDVHLDGVRFVEAHLEGANIFGGTLDGMNLTSAHLEAATFTVGMGVVNLSQAHLHGADLRRAYGLRQDQIDHAFGDAQTWLPPGVSRPDHWK